jgi:apolipoprotein N-acyltransferase
VKVHASNSYDGVAQQTRLAGERSAPPSLRRFYVLSILCAVLNVLIFPHFDSSWLAFVAFVPLLTLLANSQKLKTFFFFGWLTGFLFSLGNLNWIYFVIQHYSSVPPILCVGILILLCIVLAIFWGVFLMLAGFIRNRSGLMAALVVAPFLWVGLEWMRNHTTQFPWCLIGYSQYQNLRIAQLATISGVYGLSWIILAFNCSLAALLHRKKPQYLFVCVTILLLIITYGHFRIQIPVGAGKATIGLIQGNVPQDVKLNYAYAESIHNRHMRMTEDLIKKAKPDSVFWSEASTLFPIRTGGFWSKQIWNLAATTHVPLIIGSDTFTGEQIFNSAYLVNERGQLDGQYDKVYLVPFGEFVPFKNIFFFAGKMVPEISDFTAGTNYQPFLIKGHKVSINICFEVVFPQLSREFCRRGATLLATITNDAWFGNTAAPYQHFAQSVMRAIENRRYLVRAANTGISGFVDPYGRILQTTKLFVPAAISGEIRWISEQTFYTRYGDWLVYLSMTISSAALLGGGGLSRRNSNDRPGGRSTSQAKAGGPL